MTSAVFENELEEGFQFLAADQSHEKGSQAGWDVIEGIIDMGSPATEIFVLGILIAYHGV